MKLHLPALILATPFIPPNLHAQGQSPPAPAALWNELSGISRLDGRTIGAGPHFTAEFDQGGVTFTPGLGPESPRRHALSFRLESISRGVEVVHAAAPSAPSVREDTVLFQRTAAIEERYEVRADGVHQTFLFHEPLPGDGDLIVRGRIETTLPEALELQDGGIAFSAPGLGGVRYGAVTGIDAGGRTSPGTLRLDGDALELVLPEALVESAEYPLLLDPLVGALIGLSLTADVSEPDVAYDASNDAYLAVWSYQPAATSYELRAALIDASSGAASLITVGTGSAVSYQPSVGSVNASDRFLVAYRSDTTGTEQVRVRAVDAATGAVSGFQVAGSSVVDHTDPDVGGVRNAAGTEALVVWKQAAFGLRGAEVSVGASGNPTVSTIFTVTTDPADEDPAVSHSEGASAGTYLVVWERASQIFGLACDAYGSILAPEKMITLAATTNTKQNPDVDGDGEDFLVAYERSEAPGSALYDVWVVPVSVAGGSLTVGEFVAVEEDPSDDEREPTVAHAGAKTMIGYSDLDSDWHVYFRGLDSATGEVCEPGSAAGSAGTNVEPSLAAEYAGDPAAGDPDGGDGLFLVWKGPTIQGHLLEAFGGGTVTDLGGGCLGGGVMSSTGVPAVGNPDLDFELTGADGSTAIFSISVPGLPFICGGCESILPGAFYSTAVAVAGGDASLNVPIPSQSTLAGAAVEVQWTVLWTSTSPCVFYPNVAASNRLEVLIDF